MVGRTCTERQGDAQDGAGRRAWKPDQDAYFNDSKRNPEIPEYRVTGKETLHLYRCLQFTKDSLNELIFALRATSK